MSTRRMSGRRSYTSTWWPRRASASRDPTGPAPTMTRSGIARLADQRAEALHVLEAVVERRRRDADDVRRPRVDHGGAVEQLHRGAQSRELQDGWIGDLPGLGAADGRQARSHLEPARLVVAPPALESRQRRIGVP